MTVLTQNFIQLHSARPGPRPMTAEDLWRIPRVGAPVFSPEGDALAVPVTTYDLEKNEGRTRLWLVPVAGGEPRALTSDELSASAPVFSPDGRALAFTRKADAGKAQLFVLPLEGGEARKLTDLPLGVFDPMWLPDGSGLVFGAMLLKGHFTPEATKAELERREKDPLKAHATEERFYRYWDQWLTTGEVPHLFVVSLEDGAIRDLTPESSVWFDWMDLSGHYDLSPDGKEIAYAGISFDARRSLIVSAIYTRAVAGGPARCLTPDPPADHLRPRYSPDGTTIVWGRTLDPEFYADRVRLQRHDRSSGATREWLADWALSPMQWEWTRRGSLVIEAEERARVKLFHWSGAGAPAAVTHDGVASGLSVHGGRVACTLQTLVAPAEAHVVDLERGETRRVTSFTDAATSAFATGEVREVTFAGAHDEPVQMFVLLPPGHAEGRKAPLLQVVHGGPHGISGDQFHPRWNASLFAAPGYVVALVNFQGSTSWGQDFAQRIQGEWAARPFEDVMKATDALIATGMVDETRMAAAGGSYGGYIAAWIAGHTDRFKCIVNHAGVADLTGQYASDVTQGRGRAAGGEAWDGLEKQDRWSPIRFASGFVTPMLVIHGERDYRVPVGQGLQCYGVLKAKGMPARLVYFPDENHWILKPQNSLLWYREVMGWFARWLGG